MLLVRLYPLVHETEGQLPIPMCWSSRVPMPSERHDFGRKPAFSTAYKGSYDSTHTTEHSRAVREDAKMEDAFEMMTTPQLRFLANKSSSEMVHCGLSATVIIGYELRGILPGIGACKGVAVLRIPDSPGSAAYSRRVDSVWSGLTGFLPTTLSQSLERRMTGQLTARLEKAKPHHFRDLAANDVGKHAKQTNSAAYQQRRYPMS